MSQRRLLIFTTAFTVVVGGTLPAPADDGPGVSGERSRLDQQRDLLNGRIDTLNGLLTDYDSRPHDGRRGLDRSPADEAAERDSAAERRDLIGKRNRIDRAIDRMEGDTLSRDRRQ